MATTTVRQFLKSLNDLIEEQPWVLDYAVVYSKDDEGNAYKPVFYEPTTGNFNEDESTFAQAGGERFEPNAVCIN
jgi:hypothetical protein